MATPPRRNPVTNKVFIALYIDLENIEKDIHMKSLMDDIKLKYSGSDQEPIFAFKIGCGQASSIGKYRHQFKELNFEIRETPHIVKKNTLSIQEE